MSLKEIQVYNQNRQFFTADSEAFSPYGRILPYDAKQWCNMAAQLYPLEMEKAAYRCDDPALLHDATIISRIKRDIFGEMDIQVGIVAGQNEYLTGIEFHQGSEVNIAITDCLLLLGLKSELQETVYDANKTKAFYIEKGTVLEIFDSTLHYTPIQTEKAGFSLGVILLKGTNTDIDTVKGSMLTKKNKWYITHPSQTAKIEAGCLPGLQGELIHIKHGK